MVTLASHPTGKQVPCQANPNSFCTDLATKPPGHNVAPAPASTPPAITAPTDGCITSTLPPSSNPDNCSCSDPSTRSLSRHQANASAGKQAAAGALVNAALKSTVLSTPAWSLVVEGAFEAAHASSRAACALRRAVSDQIDVGQSEMGRSALQQLFTSSRLECYAAIDIELSARRAMMAAKKAVAAIAAAGGGDEATNLNETELLVERAKDIAFATAQLANPGLNFGVRNEEGSQQQEQEVCQAPQEQVTIKEVELEELVVRLRVVCH